MKTTLDWYKREANSYSLTKMRQILKKWDFKGAFMFIALCDTLVTLPNCFLDIENDPNTVELLCLDLDFPEEKFTEYLNDLLKYKLIIELGNFRYSTTDIQESLVITMEERIKAYERKYKRKPNYLGINDLGKSSGELSNSSGEQSNSSGYMQGELLKSSGEHLIEREEREERKEKEREKLSQIVFNESFLDEIKDVFKIKKEITLDYQKKFLKFFKMAKKTWKNPEDFRTHFLNWLKLELKNEKNNPKKEKIGQKRNY